MPKIKQQTMKQKELSSAVTKKHRKRTRGEQVMVKACKALKIDHRGDIKEMYNRIKCFYKETGHSTPRKNASKKSGDYVHYEAEHSSEKEPLTMRAKAYVDQFCQGKVASSKPEYVKSTGKEVKLMIAEVRGSKAGDRVRWVRAR
jgi:hypothetical protein